MSNTPPSLTPGQKQGKAFYTLTSSIQHCIRKRKKQGSVRPNDFQDNTTILSIFHCVGIYNNGAKAGNR